MLCLKLKHVSGILSVSTRTPCPHIVLMVAKHFLLCMIYIHSIIPLMLNIHFVFKCLNSINNTVICILKVKSLCIFVLLSTIADSKCVSTYKVFDTNCKIALQKCYNNLEFHQHCMKNAYFLVPHAHWVALLKSYANLVSEIVIKVESLFICCQPFAVKPRRKKTKRAQLCAYCISHGREERKVGS